MADALSDVLKSLRLKGAVFLDARFTAPWSVSSVVTADACKPMLSWPAQLIAYHMVIEGRMMVSIDEEPPITVREGEIVLLPRNDAHVGASETGLVPVDGYSLIEPMPGGGLARVDYGGGGARTRLLCGFLGSDENYSPLFAALPRVLVVDMTAATSKDLVEASLKYAASELAKGRLAESDIQSRLSELLLVEAVRRYVDSRDGSEVGSQSGWLRALADPGIGRALALIHQDIAAPWTTDSLAKAVAMSRSAFMDRFSSLIGMPPIKYVTSWRMETAKIRLRETPRSIAQVGHAIGYDSEEAFSRAFKREIGLSPASWREQQVKR